MIRKISDDYKLPEVTGMKNEELADKVEYLKERITEKSTTTSDLAKLSRLARSRRRSALTILSHAVQQTAGFQCTAALA